jgi:hypothetical protein
MSTTASLDMTTVQLPAGGEAVLPLQIRNNGTVVEGYQITVIGTPAAWATIDPPTLSLYPGTTTTATVTLRPPRSARTAAGEHRFGVMVTPSEHPDQAVVPEGVVEVLPFLETTAELVPRTSQGRRGRHQLAIDNRGNVPVNAMIDAASDGERLRFRLGDVGLAIPPGEAVFTPIRIKPHKRIWRGPPETHPFVVAVSPQDSTPVELEGSYVQTAVIPKWLPWLLVGLVALIGLLLALWFWVLKPTIESQAREAAEEAAAQAEEAAGEAADAAEDAGNAANDAMQTADEIDERSAPPERTTPRLRVTDESRRLHVSTAGSASEEYTLAGERTTFDLTDVLLSNPQGDFGRVRVVVDGAVRLEHALENFRDLDFHFVTPIRVQDDVTLEVVCREPGAPPAAPTPSGCDVSALLGGVLKTPRVTQ